VGRKSRRAHSAVTSKDLVRAGFEPCRGAAISQELSQPHRRISGKRLEMPRPRLAQIRREWTLGETASSARRDPPPLRFGAARFCMVADREVGRDVGFAKSGFRPTDLPPD
jgi:hypothetical protein